jgi:hypothetical protein
MPNSAPREQTPPMIPLGTRLHHRSIKELIEISAKRNIPKTRLMRIAIEQYIAQQKDTPTAA